MPRHRISNLDGVLAGRHWWSRAGVQPLVQGVLVSAVLFLNPSPAQAIPVVSALKGLRAFWDAFKGLEQDPDLLKGREFELHYFGPMDLGERLKIRVEPPDAFTLYRRDARTYVVRVDRPMLLLQQDFIRPISVHGSLESRSFYKGDGDARCTLAVSFRSDVGRTIRLSRYKAITVLWSPRGAADLVSESSDHVLFRRRSGHGHTPVSVRARLRLKDGSERVTKAVNLGYCEGFRRKNVSRAGFLVAGGGAVGGNLRPSWDIGVPFELRTDGRLHIRMTPVLFWQPSYGIGLVGQVGLGYRVKDSVGFRVGGEAGWLRRNPEDINGDLVEERDTLRAAGMFELMWPIDSVSWTEIGVRVRIGSAGGEGFGDAMVSLSWLPMTL